MNKYYLSSFINRLSPTTAYPLLLPTRLLMQTRVSESHPLPKHLIPPSVSLKDILLPDTCFHIIPLFIHSATDLLIAYCGPSNVLNAGDTEVNKTEAILAPFNNPCLVLRLRPSLPLFLASLCCSLPSSVIYP